MNILKVVGSLTIPAASAALLMASVTPSEAGTTLRRTCAEAAGGVAVNDSNQVVLTVAVGDQLTVIADGHNNQPTLVADNANKDSLAEVAPGQTVIETIDAGDPTEIRVLVLRVGDNSTVSCAPAGSLELGAAAPENAEVVIDTGELSPEQAAQRILVKLESMGFIK